MFAAKEGKVKDISKDVAQEFIDTTKSYSKLPEKFEKLKKMVRGKK